MENSTDNIDSKTEIVPVILAGGRGTRLWPLSRESYPKQFLKFNEKNDFTLLQNTYVRLKGITNLTSPIIICNDEHRFIVAEQMREIGIKPKSIILEPVSRNTAPAIALAALKAQKFNKKNQLLLILSADHIIEDSNSLRESILNAHKYAYEGRLITFGITPYYPETGFGYIEASEELSNKNNSSSIKKFIEKPNKELAEKLIKNKLYTWNSGIFLFKASKIIEEISLHNPQIIKLCKESIKEEIYDLEFQRINEDKFKQCPDISIDNAVMEKTKLGTVTLLDAGWSDIGNWKTIWDKSNKDEYGNSLNGRTIIKDSKNCYLRSENRLVVGLGLDNLVVIETKDAILVANKNHAQNIKSIVSDLNKKNFSEGKIHDKIYRPWGNFITIEENDNWKVKKIEINPGARISLQMHNHRSEHWVVVSGIANVEIDGNLETIKANESIYVPKKCKHRLSNLNKQLLTIIEIQSGHYLGEDDIIRFQDLYGRN